MRGRPQLPERERAQQRGHRRAQRQRADLRAERGEQHEDRGDREALGVGRAGHPQAEQALAHQVEHRPAEHHRQPDAVQRAPRLGDEQVVADRDGDDARHDRGVQIGVGVACQPARVLAGAHHQARALGDRAEVQPPQCGGLEERDAEAEDDRGGQAGVRGRRAGDDDRLAERDDDEALAAVGEVAALDVVVGGHGAAAARQPVAGHRGAEVEHDGRDPQQQPPIAGQRRARQPQHAGRRAPADEALEDVAQRLVAAQQARGRGVAPDLQRDVADREQHAVRAERARQRGGHEQAREHHAGEHRAHRRRRRVEPVGHPGRVDPRPPHDQQQERRPPDPGDRQVAEDHVRQLRDREDVDQVEEQLDRRDRLLDALAPRAQVACRWSTGDHGRNAVQEQRRAVRAVVGEHAAHEHGRHRDRGHHGRDDRGDGDDRHGHHDREDQQGRADQQPEEDDQADLRDAQAAAGHLDDLRAHLEGRRVPGERGTDVVGGVHDANACRSAQRISSGWVPSRVPSPPDRGGS